MAIRPVSSVSFNNYNVGFEGKKHKTPENRHSSNPIKAIPLAALIAMSPMALAEDAFSLEPQETKIENIYGPEQSRVVPLPSNCTVLKQINIELPEGGAKVYKLIDTNGDGSNFEMLECINIGATGRVYKRGILKSVTNYDARTGNMLLEGIELSNTDLDDYMPFGILGETYKSTQLSQMYNEIVAMPSNNGALRKMFVNQDYKNEYFKNDLLKYKRVLGIQ